MNEIDVSPKPRLTLGKLAEYRQLLSMGNFVGVGGDALRLLVDEINACWAERKPEKNGNDAEDAAKWRAFRNCARIRVIGGAGFEQNDNYRFLTLEVWTEYPGVPSDPSAINFLEKFVAASRRVIPVEPTAGSNNT